MPSLSAAHLILELSPTNTCMQVCGCNSLSVMLAAKGSVNVVSEVNLRNPLPKQMKHPGFEIRGRRHQKSNSGVSGIPQKGPMPRICNIHQLKHKPWLNFKTITQTQTEVKDTCTQKTVRLLLWFNILKRGQRRLISQVYDS